MQEEEFTNKKTKKRTLRQRQETRRSSSSSVKQDSSQSGSSSKQVTNKATGNTNMSVAPKAGGTVTPKSSIDTPTGSTDMNLETFTGGTTNQVVTTTNNNHTTAGEEIRRSGSVKYRGGYAGNGYTGNFYTPTKTKKIKGVASMNVNFNNNSATLKLHGIKYLNSKTQYNMTVVGKELSGDQVYIWAPPTKGSATGTIEGDTIKGSATVRRAGDSFIEAKVKYNVKEQK
jgi:hypothetical protein